MCLVLGERERERERERDYYIALIVFVYHVSLLVCVPMSHPHGAIGCSVIRHCGISRSLAFVCCFFMHIESNDSITIA